MMLALTNAEIGQEKRRVFINTDFIVAIYDLFDDETRIRTSDGEEYIVAEGFDEIGKLWVKR